MELPTTSMNASLEALRDSVLPRGERAIQVALPDEQNCRRVHAGFLFTTALGKKILHDIELFLADTRDGWEPFANGIGLNYPKILSIRNRFCAEPVFYSILAKTQYKDFTLQNIIHSLNDIHRYDVLHKITEDVKYLARQVINKNPDIVNIIIPFSLKDHQDTIPFVLRDDVNSEKRISQRNSVECSTNAIVRNIEKKTFTKIVLLTYLDDATNIVRDISLKFSSTNIGILDIEDNKTTVLPDPERIITEWCDKADYIVPILSKDYVCDLRTNFRYVPRVPGQNLNSKYAWLIYRQMNLLSSGRCNKIRCVIPNDCLGVLKDPLLKSPLFQIWFTEKSLEGFIESAV